VNKHLGSLEEVSAFRVMALEGQEKRLTYHLRAPNDSRAWTSLFFRNAGLPFYGIMNKIQYSLYLPVDGLSSRESNVLFELFMEMGGFKRAEVLQRTNSLYIATLDQLVMPAANLEGTYATGSTLELNLYRVDDTLDRVYFASGVHKAASPADALKSLLDPSFPIRESVILEDPALPSRGASRETAEAKLLYYASQSVLCETNSGVPGYLVLLDSYYPGWVSYLDGKEVQILRANYCFRAVEVPAGRHRVEFRYRPRSFYAGLAITLLSLASGALLLCSHARRKSC